jgi:hypothetical protein
MRMAGENHDLIAKCQRQRIRVCLIPSLRLRADKAPLHPPPRYVVVALHPPAPGKIYKRLIAPSGITLLSRLMLRH